MAAAFPIVSLSVKDVNLNLFDNERCKALGFVTSQFSSKQTNLRSRNSARCAKLLALTFERLQGDIAHGHRFQSCISCANQRDDAWTTELPDGLAEEDYAKFAEMDDDFPSYGPPAVLLIGFSPSGVAVIQELLRNIGGEFVRVIVCTSAMMSNTVADAVHVGEQGNVLEVEAAKNSRRVCLLSGLNGEEMVTLVSLFPESEMDLPVFAAFVEGNADKILSEVVEEILEDDRRMNSSGQTKP
eukprot:TRINITY_DN3331_c0_g1_i1.p1 TRINITY_DN3331_c0_g1~~TRINITY_DN3331_c0_g1_i1.p1  ORF type:complete len:242 (+),score=49.08 TRINITY_DN3331_c0_g1_i1:57-782(+)